MYIYICACTFYCLHLQYITSPHCEVHCEYIQVYACTYMHEYKQTDRHRCSESYCTHHTTAHHCMPLHAIACHWSPCTTTVPYHVIALVVVVVVVSSFTRWRRCCTPEHIPCHSIYWLYIIILIIS